MPRSAPETNLQNDGRLCIGSLPFVRLYRNNTGTLNDRNGTPVSYGLAVGSADTIGIVMPHGRFLSIEWKRPGWVAPVLTTDDFGAPRGSLSDAKKRHIDQCNWRDQVNGMNGVAGFASSLEEGLRLTYLATLPYNVDPSTDAVADWVDRHARQFRERMAERDQRKNRHRK